MRIVGFLETSFVDWDGRLASVVFLGGCNFVCPFCHNHRVASDDPDLVTVDWDLIQVALIRKHDWLDGVVVSGGEPMMHPEVFTLCSRIKSLGFKVKLDTNGSFPYALKRLIEAGLVDAVAMDIKAPLGEKYSRAAGRAVDLAPIIRCIRLLIEAGIEHEFRATLVPGLIDPEDVERIGAAIRGAGKLALQHFEPANARVPGIAEGPDYSRAAAEAMAERLRSFVKTVILRGKFD
ncbi:anaerobic ribonucleoside-triphosphate reductase activating protein [candidate division WOR-3 bacterium]|nr:anaerobic ribonucleoside-triphosphate reductase activating protein [candidate division WOR-3 bacterium]